MFVRSPAIRRRSFVMAMPVFGLSLSAVLAGTSPALAQELPSGGQIVAGQATIGGNGAAMMITQSTDKAIINWTDFSIGEKGSVRIENGQGATLNRVTGTAVSSIDGLLSATGSVYLINKNGIVVGKAGQIDVGGRFVGSTQDISNEGFLAGGSQTLQGASEASILNYGKIGSLGGDVALIAAKVENQGEISAAKGTVGLLAGYQVILRDQSLNDGKFSVVVGGSGTTATNLGAIRAAEAELRAQGGNVYALAGNTGGVINATGLSTSGGRIFLTATNGETHVGGALIARKADGTGGMIEVTAKNVLLFNSARIDASGTTGGTVLVGGDWQGGADASLKLAVHDIAPAEAVVMDTGANIDVSGTAGAGGKAVLWSDNYTNFLGTIAARGATNGGAVETSSKGILNAIGSVDAAAANGAAGKWLLDPSDITISTATTSGGAYSGASPNVFTPSAATSVANVGTINSSLNAGTSVLVTTASGAAGTGNITLANPISKTAGGNATLTLQAEGSIILNSSITASGAGTGKLNVNLNSRSANAAAGYIAISDAITTNGGDLNAWGGNGGVNSGAAISATIAQSGVSVAGATGNPTPVIDAGGGNISMIGNNVGISSGPNYGILIQNGSTVRTSGTGTINLTANGGSSYGLVSTGAIQSAAGAITLNGTSAGIAGRGVGIALLGGSVTSGTGNITAIATSTGADAAIYVASNSGATSITSSSGNIAITGTSSGTARPEGIYMTGSSAITISTGGTGAIALVGTGGADLFASNRTKSGIGFGASNGATPLTIAAGTGGLVIAGNSPSTADYSVYGYLTASSSISSAGTLTVGGDTAVPGVRSLGVNLANAAISATGALRVGASTSGDVVLGNVSGASSIEIGAQTGAVTLGTVTKTGGTGIVSLGAGTSLNAGAITLATNDATTIAATGALTTGAISTTGNGNITLTSGTDIYPAAITKRAAATGASSLRIASAGSIEVLNAITAESGAGAFNVTLNSRSADTVNGTTQGYIYIAAPITTRGGNILGYGSTDPTGAAYSASTANVRNGLWVNGAALDAGGGNVALRGITNTTSGLSGLVLTDNSSVTTTGTGGITLTGGGASSGNGLNIYNVTMSSGSGGINLTGSSNSGNGVAFISATQAINANTGDLTINGTSATGIGVVRYTTGLGTFQGRNVSITGSSTSAANSVNGILLTNSSTDSATNSRTNITGTNSVTLTGTGGAAGASGFSTSASAITFGNSYGNTSVAVSAGVGGLTVTGTNPTAGTPNSDGADVNNGAILFSFDNFTSASQGYSYNSAGTVNITGNKTIVIKGAVTQTGGGDSTISAGNVLRTAAVTSSAGLTLNASTGYLATNGVGSPAAVSAANGLTMNAGGYMLAGALSAGASLRATAGLAVTAGNITQTGTTGPVAVTGGAAVSLGTVNLATNNATAITAGTTLSTGAITTTGSGDIALTAGSTLSTPSITKRAAATGASTLTIKSTSDLTVDNAILAESGAGALNVLLNSRSGGAAAGLIAVNSNITSQGGNIYGWGGSGAANSGAATSTTSATAVTIGTNVALAAAGGNIAFSGSTSGSGTTSASNGLFAQTGSSITTSGTGTITLTGSSAAANGNVISGSITSSAGAISLTGTSGAGLNIGVGLGIGGPSITSGTGNITLLGTNTGGEAGLYINSNSSATSISSASGNISLTGVASGPSAIEGIVTLGGNATSITTGGAGAVSLSGTGGTLARDSFRPTRAIGFGGSNLLTPLTISAGTGGLTMVGNAPASAAYSIQGYLATAAAFTSTGAISIGTATPATGFSSLGVSLPTAPITAGGALLVRANTGDIVLANISSGGAVTIGAGGSVTTGTFAQTGSTGAVNVTAGTSITTGTVAIATNDAATGTNFTAGTTLTTGAITDSGNGNVTLASGSALTTPSITKRAAATGASNLLIRSNAGITVANPIVAEAGAGAFNVTLNSRAADTSNAVNATVAISGAVTTQGGNILVRGGAAPLTAVVAPSTDFTGFNSTLNATGTAITLGSGVLNAGGGNIELRALASTGDGFSMSTGTLSTTGNGNLSIYGLGSPAAAINGNGVTISGGTVSAVNGNVTVYGASRHTSGTVGVLVSGGEVRTTAGSLAVSGAAPSTINAGTGAIGVQVNGRLTVAGGSGTLSVAGQGGGAATASQGVSLYGGTVNSASSGAVTITGTGGGGTGTSNYGISLDQQGAVTPLINTTGSGPVTLTGAVAGATTIGIFQGASGPVTIGTNTMTGPLTLAANNMFLNGAGGAARLMTSGVLTVRPLAGGSLVLDSNILPAIIAANALRGNYSSVVFGSADAASLVYTTAAGANSWSIPLAFSSSGAITIADGGAGTPLIANQGLSFGGTGTVTQAVDITASTLSGTANSVNFNRAGNRIRALAGLAVTGDLALIDASALAIQGTNTVGTGLIRTSGDLTFAAGGSVSASGTGTPLQLTTATKVVNNAGASALAAPNGRWLLYSQDPGNDTLGALSYAFKQFGSAYGVTTPAQATGNGVLYALSPTLSVSLTGTYSRVYDGTVVANLAQSNYAVTGLIGSDAATIYSTATFDTKNVGTGKLITADDMAFAVRNGSVRVYGYSLSTTSATANMGAITVKSLTASLTGTTSKVYDGSTAASLTAANVSLSGVVAGDTVDVASGLSGTYANKNVGTGKAVTAIGVALTGADAANYTVVSGTSGNIGTITAKTLGLDLTGTTGKVYDGNTAAALTSGNYLLTGVVTGDTVSATGGTGTYADKNVGIGKAVTANGVVLTGVDARNYTAASSATGAIGAITAKALTASLTGTTSKAYDGTTSATLLAGNYLLNGIVGSDSVALAGGTATYADRNVGVGKSVAVTGLGLTGTDSANYTVSNNAAGDIGVITAKTLTASLTGVIGKVYDGSTIAAVGTSNVSLAGIVAGDTVDVASGLTGAYGDRNVGTSKAVTATGVALTGANAGNYAVATSTSGNVGTITAKAVTLAAVSDSKVYDGTTVSSGAISATGLVLGDVAVATQAFDSRNAGARTLQVQNGYTIADGNGGANYAITLGAAAAGTITPRTLNVSARTDTKIYDGTITSSVAVVTSGLVPTDTITAIQAFDSKDAGSRSLQVQGGYTIADGNGGANYQVVLGSAVAGTITPKALTATVTVNDKIYDGTTTATGSVDSIDGFIAGDAVTVSGGTVAFVDRNAGNGKAVTVTGYTLSGASAGNYTLGPVGGTSANITRAGLTLTAGTVSKVYDGTTVANGTVTASGLVDFDTFGGAAEAFDSRNAGSRTLQVVANSWTINDGNGGNNYAVTLAAPVLGTITSKALTLTAITDSKVYDGNTGSTGAVQASGLILGDVVTASQEFDSRNAGNRTLQVRGGYAIADGNGGANYLVSLGSAVAGTITPKALTTNVTVANKVYDATTSAAGSFGSLDGIVAGDAVSVDPASGALAFLDGNAGTGKAVSATGYGLRGGDAGNYTLGAITGLSADILRATLELTAGYDSKIYDGNTVSSGNVTAVGFFGSDTLAGATQAFDSRNAGNRATQVTGWTIADGNGGGNYTVVTRTGTGTITPKALTMTAVADSKVYDGTVGSTGIVAAEGLVTGDSVSAIQVFDSKNAGARTLQVANGYTITDGNGGANYAVTLGAAAPGTISQKLLAADVAVNDKVYDTTTVATGAITGLTGVINGDVVTVDGTTGTLRFADRNAGAGKAVTATGYALTGADAGNYALGTLANGTATINRADLVLTAETQSKIYDGTTASTGVVSATGLLGTDTLVSAAQAFDSRNAGSRALQVIANSWTIDDGNGGGNYAVTLAAPTAGNIAARALTLNAVADSKVYDRTTSSAGVVQADGLVTGDTFLATQAFDSRNVGSRTLQVQDGYTIQDGNSGGNYVVAFGTAAAGSITPKTILADVTVANKVYDATTGASGTFDGLAGVIGGDVVSVDQSSGRLDFVDRNAGNGKAVTATGYVLTGTDAGNYTLSNIANGVADISRAALILNAVGQNKVYDGTTVSTGIVTASGLVGFDTLIGATQAFDSKNAGSRTLQVQSGYVIADGNNGNNYTVSLGAAAAGTIAQRALSAALTGTVLKVYDGLVDAVVQPTNLAGVLAGDAVTVSASSAMYDDKNVGTNKLVTVTGLSLSGADSANYVLQTGSTSGYVGTITPRAITVSATGRGAKTYDGTDALTQAQLGTINLTAASGDTFTQGLLGSDGVTLDTGAVVGTLADRNAGTGKVTTLGGFNLSGDTFGNYVLASSTTQAVSDVGRAALLLSAVTDGKTYDGTTASSEAVQATGLVGGDSFSAIQAFDSRNAGSRTLQVQNGYVVSDGNNGGNYAVTIDAAAAGTIAQRLVTTTLTANDKVYDGTTVATGSFSALLNLVAGDTAAVDPVSGALAFSDRNVGSAKIVTAAGVGLVGADAANYQLGPIADASAAITPKALLLTAGTDSRAYDGTVASSGTVQASSLAAGDSFTATQAFDSKDAGDRILQVQSGYVVNDGNNGGNYLVNIGAGTAGTITKRLLTTNVTVADKVYDGLTVASGTFGALQNVVAGDSVTLNGSGVLAFTDRNAGTNKAVTVTGLGLTGADVANYQLSSSTSSTASITQRAVTLTAVSDSKVYDRTTASVGVVQASGIVFGDTLVASQQFDGRTAGSHTLQVANGWFIADGNNGNNYAVVIDGPANGTITPKTITANVSVNGKVYDGTTVASGIFTGTSGVIDGDVVTIDGTNGTVAFLDRNAGNGKTVTAAGATLSGADAGNYVLGSVANGTANIARAALTLTALADSKVYDGTTVSGRAVGIAGLVDGDTATASQTFDSKNAGNRTLQVTGLTIEDGNNGGNYAVTRLDASGSIAQKTINAALTGTVSKVYDGGITATILPTNLDGIIAGDAVTVGASSAEYADRNVGTGKLVTVTGITLNGADAGNYILNGTTAAANVGTITPRVVAVTASGRGTKTYDGTTVLSHNQLGSIVLSAAEDDVATRTLLVDDGVSLVTDGVTGTLVDRNAGTGKATTLTGYVLGGNTLGNYVLASTTTQGLSDITRAALTLTAASDGKVYDGTTASTGAVRIFGLVAGDTATATQAFDSRNAGSRILLVNGYTVSDGNDGGNYAVTLVGTAGNIAQRLLSTAVSVDSKVYDGTTVATGTFGGLDNLVSGDSVALTGGTLAFADRNVGSGKAVTVRGTILTGADAGNYQLAPVVDGIASITPRALTLTAVSETKVYDGTTTSAGAVIADGLVGGDTVSASQSFDDRTAGTRRLQVDGYTIADGNGGRNYLVTTSDPVTGTIARRTLYVTVSANDKVYDGNTVATGTFGALSNSIGIDAVTLDSTQGTLSFVDRNVGSGKAVNVGGLSLVGADAGNYQLASIANGTAAITPKALTLNAVGDSKVYDGTVGSTGIVQATGLVVGDTVAAAQAFDGRTAGAHLIQVTGWSIGDGNGGNNYVVSLGDVASGTIAQRILSATVNAQSKVYDGTAIATGSFSGLSNVVAGDTVVLDSSNGSFVFADRNVGTGKAVTVSGVSLGGIDAGNYLLSSIGLSTGSITRKALTLTASGDAKVYDGTTTSSGTVTSAGLVTGDGVTATQSFDSKNAGTRTLQVSGWTIDDGNAGGNYQVVLDTAANGSIAQKVLTAALTGTVSKVYDRTNAATILPTNIDGVIAGDAITVLSSAAEYDDANVGTGKRVTVAGLALSGADAGNYILNGTSASANVGTITPRTVTVTVSGRGTKTYDGTDVLGTGQLGTLAFAAAAGDTATQDMLAADGVGLGTGSVTGLLADRNAGTGKSVILTGYDLVGNGLGNYVLASTSTQGLADIGRAKLTLTAASDSKVYDGTTASAGLVQVAGLVAGDSLTATQAFDGRNAGDRLLNVIDYTVADGNGGANYQVFTASAEGDIAQRLLTVRLNDAAKSVGETDPIFTYAVRDGDLVAGDTLFGAVTRQSGEDAGTYAIRQGSLTAGANYTLNVSEGRLTINAVAPGTGGGTTPGTGTDNGGGTDNGTGGGTTPGTGTGNGGGTDNGTGGGTTPGTGTGNGGGTDNGTGGGTTPGTGTGDGGGTDNGTGGGTTPGTGTGNGGGSDNGTGGGTSPGTGTGGSIAERAQIIAEQATRVLPGNMPANATLQPGLVGMFDPYASFGFVGTSRIPGEPAVTVQDTTATASPTEDQATPQIPLCTEEGQDSGACAAVGGSGLPYSTNRVVSSVLRFFKR